MDQDLNWSKAVGMLWKGWLDSGTYWKQQIPTRELPFSRRACYFLDSIEIMMLQDHPDWRS
eukprot:scaffold14244_cov78-Skeletonema_marinoi.AAC.4